MIVFMLFVQSILASINCIKSEDLYFFKFFKIGTELHFLMFAVFHDLFFWYLYYLLLLIPKLIKNIFLNQNFPHFCVNNFFLIKHDFLVLVTASYFFFVVN